MAEPQVLTLAFVTSHPAEAARVLERIPGADAAALFENIPARNGAPVLIAMLPSAAARVVGDLTDETALALLTATGMQGAVTVLRYVPQPRRGHLISGLPTATAVASRALLGYAEDTAGAWIDPEIIAASPDTPARTALERVRAGREAQVEQVYAVDNEERLVGTVDLHVLLRAPDATTLAALMHRPPAVLTANTPLVSAASQRGWERTSVLPVVDRGRRLIGVIRRAALLRALARNRGASQPVDEASLAGLLARGYWDAVSGLAETSLSALPPAKPVWRDES
ncbi:MAG: CBS domain-containing protein [Burkholderiales bacterium]